MNIDHGHTQMISTQVVVTLRWVLLRVSHIQLIWTWHTQVSSFNSVVGTSRWVQFRTRPHLDVCWVGHRSSWPHWDLTCGLCKRLGFLQSLMCDLDPFSFLNLFLMKIYGLPSSPRGVRDDYIWPLTALTCGLWWSGRTTGSSGSPPTTRTWGRSQLHTSLPGPETKNSSKSAFISLSEEKLSISFQGCLALIVF